MSNVFSHLLAKIAPEQLMQIHFRNNPSDFSVGTVLFYTDAMLVVSLVDQMGNSDGVSMILHDKIAYLKTDSLYLQSFQKKPHTQDSLKQNQQVWQTIKGESFAECLAKAAKEKVVLEVVDESELGLNGIVVACEKGLLTLDEYLEENSHRHAQVHIPLEHIYRLNFNCPWLRSLALRIN